MSGLCRGCAKPLAYVLVDLGAQPFSNAYLATADEPETIYPLRAYVCTGCWLVQIPAVAPASTMFTADYAYYSSANPAFVAHAEHFVAEAIDRLSLYPRSHVLEIASNDGYLLGHFKRRGYTNVLGVEPAEQCAAVGTRLHRVPAVVGFFTAALARTLPKSDLVIANNVLAHVPNLHDFVEGLRIVLKAGGRVSLEFPWVVNLLEHTQFDTIYHEHFSYFSLTALKPVFAAHGLIISGVEMLTTHGGSLRVWLEHAAYAHGLVGGGMFFDMERSYGLDRMAIYDAFAGRVRRCRAAASRYVLGAKKLGLHLACYGAAAKGNTFLNYCGFRADLFDYVADATPAKVGRFMPGSRIPIVPEALLRSDPPDQLLLLPWNWAPALTAKARGEYGYTGAIVTAVPRLHSELLPGKPATTVYAAMREEA